MLSLVGTTAPSMLYGNTIWYITSIRLSECTAWRRPMTIINKGLQMVVSIWGAGFV